MNDPTVILSSMKNIREKYDIDPASGRLFSYLYETGDDNLRMLAHRVFDMFLDSNALDPTVFRSALLFEKKLVDFSKSLVSADEDVVGTVTYGGTESIMLAVKSARWVYRRSGKASGVPEIVVPATGHPSIRKAAHYLDMRVVRVPVDQETKKADPERVKEAINERTALVVVSAPNFPYGVVDPIRDIAGYASDMGVPVHVDACVGGFILPFMESIGLRVEPFDFRVEGVTSLSMDAHKYGYAPKGVSVVLFRGTELKKGTVYVDLEWPGYPFINTTVLSSRSVAPMAAAYAVIEYLGRSGYERLTRQVVEARDSILHGLSRLGFDSVAPVETPLLSLAMEDEEDLFKFHALMSLRGWIIGLQPRLPGVAPVNIHLTVSPIHLRVVHEFLEDARQAVESPSPEELARIFRLIKEDPMSAARMVGETPYDSIIIAKLLESMPPDIAEEIARELTVEVYK